jgi:hypothetical protein
MNPTSTDCIPEQFQFKRVESRQVIVNFKGGTVTSDAGLTLIADLDQKLKITSRLAVCFQDCCSSNGFSSHTTKHQEQLFWTWM